MAHVFISYAHEDKVYARKLADYLLKNGFDVWIDDRIDSGTNWEHAIFKAIESCDAFVIIMTPASYDSPWVQREGQHADNHQKKAFPLLLEGKVFPFYAPIQYYDVRNKKLPEQSFINGLEKFTPITKTIGRDVAKVASQQAATQSQHMLDLRRLRILVIFLAILVVLIGVGSLGYILSNEGSKNSSSNTQTATLIQDRNTPGQVAALSTSTQIMTNTFAPSFTSTETWTLTPLPSSATPTSTATPTASPIATFTSTRIPPTTTFTATRMFTPIPTTAIPVSTISLDDEHEQIAFVSDRDGNDEIYVMDADGNNLYRLTNNTASDLNPTWSPDGRQIIFASNRDGNFEIYITVIASQR